MRFLDFSVTVANRCTSRDIIIGVYVIIFGLGRRSLKSKAYSRANECTAVAGLELLPQVPPYVPKYASFLFSFLGRGVCEYSAVPGYYDKDLGYHMEFANARQFTSSSDASSLRTTGFESRQVP